MGYTKIYVTKCHTKYKKILVYNYEWYIWMQKMETKYHETCHNYE